MRGKKLNSIYLNGLYIDNCQFCGAEIDVHGFFFGKRFFILSCDLQVEADMWHLRSALSSSVFVRARAVTVSRESP